MSLFKNCQFHLSCPDLQARRVRRGRKLLTRGVWDTVIRSRKQAELRQGQKRQQEQLNSTVSNNFSHFRMLTVARVSVKARASEKS